MVPPFPTPPTDINTSVPVAIKVNHTSSVEVAVQHDAVAKPLAVDPTFV